MFSIARLFCIRAWTLCKQILHSSSWYCGFQWIQECFWYGGKVICQHVPCLRDMIRATIERHLIGTFVHIALILESRTFKGLFVLIQTCEAFFVRACWYCQQFEHCGTVCWVRASICLLDFYVQVLGLSINFLRVVQANEIIMLKDFRNLIINIKQRMKQPTKERKSYSSYSLFD